MTTMLIPAALFRSCPVRSRALVLLPVVLLLSCVAPCGLFAGPEGDSLAVSPSLLDEAGRVGCAGWSTIITPFHWNGTDALRAGGVLAATTTAFLLDDEVKRLMDRNHTAGLDKVENVVVRYGETKVVIILSGGVYLAGLVGGDPWLRETGLLAGAALLITGAGTQLVKAVAGRARPYTGYGPHYFTPFTGDEDFHSFPSGHATAAFTLSSVLAARIDNPWATAALYGMATATALSRVYSGNHWFSDVVFGALAASAAGRRIVSVFEGEARPATGFEVIPQPTGISLVYRF
jgi:membrane-associated phospholipid phosphatase